MSLWRHSQRSNGALQQYRSPRPTLVREFPRQNHLFPQPSSSMFCAHFPLPLLPRTPTTFIAFPPNPLLLGPRRSNGGRRENTTKYMKHAVLKEKGGNAFLLEKYRRYVHSSILQLPPRMPTRRLIRPSSLATNGRKGGGGKLPPSPAPARAWSQSTIL